MLRSGERMLHVFMHLQRFSWPLSTQIGRRNTALLITFVACVTAFDTLPNPRAKRDK
jgi:hypothetical protein